MQFTGTNQVTLVSFTYVDIWPGDGTNKACMPIFGHTYFGHYNSANLGPIGLTFFMGTQETIICRLVMSNPSYDDYFLLIFFDFLGHFWRENERGSSKPNQKVGPLGGPFGPTAMSESCLRNFQAWTPSFLNRLTGLLLVV